MDFKKQLDYLEQFAKIGSILAFSVMSIMSILQILARYVFDNNSLYFSEELSRFMFVWTVSLAAAVCVRRQQHAAIDLFVGQMPKKVRRFILIFSWFCCCVFFSILFIYGISITQAVWKQVSPAMEVSMSLVYAAMPVGGLLMLIFSLENMFALIRTSSQDNITIA